jgi:hypothetical protein
MSEPRLRLTLLILLILFLPAGCTPAQTELIFPANDAVRGWMQSERVSFTHDDLFSLVNGQAESFLAYGFERVDVQRYQNDSGGQVNVEVWRLADSGGAYGLWTAMRSGAPAGVGNDSDSDGARRFAFWQDSAFVQVTANQPLETSQLGAFARTVASSLPEGGERPALLERVPQGGLQPGRLIYFREELSIQNEVYLGGENILGLSQQTGGILARYTLDGQEVRLLLVEYPEENQAVQALPLLQNYGLEGLLISGVKGRWFGAVFGQQSGDAVVNLLTEALQP